MCESDEWATSQENQIRRQTSETIHVVWNLTISFEYYKRVYVLGEVCPSFQRTIIVKIQNSFMCYFIWKFGFQEGW